MWKETVERALEVIMLITGEASETLVEAAVERLHDAEDDLFVVEKPFYDMDR